MQLSATHRSKGFALLITVTLLAFLVLLLVSLATLTRVETQVANNSQQRSQAQQNALMALNIAIGQLQKYAGPDQRTTARSDIFNTKTTDNPPTSVDYTVPSGRWTGAYGNGVTVGVLGDPDKYGESPSTIQTNLANYYTDPANASDPYVLKGSQARLLNWLVSGNEGATFAAATSGQITAKGTGITFAPTDAVTNLTGKTASSTDITVKNATSFARLLVGPNSVTEPTDYVAAPLVPISAVVPGLNAAVTVGNYAWWVGDEGTKARVNLPMADSTQAANAFASAQRAAVELIDAINPSSMTSSSMLGTKAPSYNPNDPDFATNLPKLVTLRQFSMLPILSTADSNTVQTASKYRYHDLTLNSTSVLSDTYAGGLKKDLSALLANISPSTYASPYADTDFIFKPESNASGQLDGFGMPTWGLLRSHVQTFASTTGLTPSAPTMVKIPSAPDPVPTASGIYPITTYATLGMAYGVPEADGPPFDAVGKRLRLAFFPVVVLWNPYTSPIAAAKYQIGFRKIYDSWFEFQYFDTTATPNAWKILDLFNLDADRYIRFIIDAPAIPAGQSYVFSLRDKGKDYSAASASNPLTIGLRSGNYTLNPSSSPNMAIAATNRSYRVGVNGRPNESEGPPPLGSKADSGNRVVKTLFSNNTHNFGRGTSGSCYLAPENAPAPNSDFPYNTTTYASRNWYQSMAALDAGNGVWPYGLNPGFSRSTLINGLFRNEGAIDMISEPTFRMSFRAQFKNSRNRWITDANPRGFLLSRPPNGGGSPINWTITPGDASWPNALKTFDDPALGDDTRASAGTSLNDSSATATAPVDVALFEFRPEDQPLLSIGQLQHANLAWLSHYPSYAIGNSVGPPYLSGTPKAVMKVTNPGGASYDIPLANKSSVFYDLSWLLNRSLWDKYCVSTVPYAGTGKRTDTTGMSIPPKLPNPRHIRYVSVNDATLTDAQRDANLRTSDKATAGLLLAGGFNINSTSEQAWRAVLGGINLLPYDPVGRTTGSALSSALSRFSAPIAGSPTIIDATNAWNGYRSLNSDQIAVLAQNIVTEIRSRGPFVSLADFINRRLANSPDPGTGTDPFPRYKDKRLKGTIQAALDATVSGTGAVNSNATTPFTTPLVSENWSAPVTNVFKAGMVASNNTLSVVAPVSSVASFAPQYLTQADVLSAIGSGLTARSDTFVIRTYGETVNPTDSTQITGRAWCEAVVQRTPDYLDATQDPNAQDAPTALINKKMGRRFKILSFRWLSPNDI